VRPPWLVLLGGPIQVPGNGFPLPQLSPTVKFVSLAAGLLLIAIALHDVFHTLFHPAGRGAISDYAARAMWKIFRPIAKRRYGAITLAGPFAFLTIMGLWLWTTIFGFALIYTPYIQTRYVLASGIPEHPRNFMDALNVSLGGLITLGGDINPTTRSLRFIEGVEAVVGFALLTASVSWLLSLYPVLERRRTVGHELNLLHNAELETGLNVLDFEPSETQEVLWGLSAEFAELRNDLAQFPITYYFHSGERHSGLSGAIPYIAAIAEAASRPNMAPAVRVAGVCLGGAIDDYLNDIAKTFLRIPTHDKNEIMRRLADDQMRQTYSLPGTANRPAA